LLKDFVDGKLIYLEWPPDTPEELICHVPVVDDDGADAAAGQHSGQAGPVEDGVDAGQEAERGGEPRPGGSTSAGPASDFLDDGELELMKDIQISNKPRRAEHKFHKKAAKTKGTRGQIKDSGVEGFGVMYGKKGGIIRASNK